MRELEQSVRRILMTGHYAPSVAARAPDLVDRLVQNIKSADGSMDASRLLATYCAILYRRHGTCEEVARRTKLDRRTVKKYVLEASS